MPRLLVTFQCTRAAVRLAGDEVAAFTPGGRRRPLHRASL
jgi:hypothetical protein